MSKNEKRFIRYRYKNLLGGVVAGGVGLDVGVV